VVLQLADRADRRTRGRGDGLPQRDRCSPESRSIVAATDRGLHDQLGGDRARQAEQDAGVDHRLDQEEEVRRAAARQRVTASCCDSGTRMVRPDRLEISSVRRRCSSLACAPAEIALIAWSTSTACLSSRARRGRSATGRSMKAVGLPAAP
jgi:hypothetical protein